MGNIQTKQKSRKDAQKLYQVLMKRQFDKNGVLTLQLNNTDAVKIMTEIMDLFIRTHKFITRTRLKKEDCWTDADFVVLDEFLNVQQGRYVISYPRNTDEINIEDFEHFTRYSETDDYHIQILKIYLFSKIVSKSVKFDKEGIFRSNVNIFLFKFHKMRNPLTRLAESEAKPSKEAC